MPRALLLLLLLVVPIPVAAQQCRRVDGPWEPCRLDVIDTGRRWDLMLSGGHWQISHDGSGTVKVREGQGDWTSAQPRWEEPGVLCWGGICTRGALPLD